MQSSSLDAWPEGCRSKSSTTDYPSTSRSRHPQSYPSCRVSTPTTLFSDYYSPEPLPKYQPLLTKAALSEHNLRHQNATQSSQHISHKRLSSLPEPTLLRHLPQKRRRAKSLSHYTTPDRASYTYNNSSPENFYEAGLESLVDTQPHETTSLWNLVRMPPKKQDKYNPSATGSTRTRSSTKAASKAQTAETTESGNKTGKGKDRMVRTGPYSMDFEVQILAPRGITIDRSSLPVTADMHFGVLEAQGNRSDYYTRKGAASAPIWLEVEGPIIETVMEMYKCYESEGLGEAEFATYAKDVLFKMDPLAVMSKDSRCWRARRMVELVTKPDPTIFWAIPPLVGDESSVSGFYEFDVRPDCSYWLSVEAFNSTYKSLISALCLVVKRKMFCPYLTIEFKKDDSVGVAAENQVAAAGSIALYNRFCLKQSFLKVTGTINSQTHQKNIKHYGITMKGALFLIWCLTPVVDHSFQWAGCNMTRISLGYCTEKDDLRTLFTWINEIHYWGVKVHGPECENDIKNSLKTNPSGPRISDIMPVNH